MYKKIKNSSFMNIFWFILYCLPLIMIIVFSINFYRNDEINLTSTNVSCDNLIDYNDFYIRSTTEYIDYDNNCFNITLDAHQSKKIWFGTQDLDYYDGLIYCFTSDNLVDSRVFSHNTEADDYFFITSSSDYTFSYGKIQLMDDDDEGYSGVDLYNNRNQSINVNVFFGVLDIDTNVSYDALKNYFLINTNNDNFEIVLQSGDYATYLQDNFYNTFSHTGIIYNMFINLFSYFGVLNIYIKIISVYLEYIILISLIHLAVDILLLLPNICHKFMEKVGGERD